MEQQQVSISDDAMLLIEGWFRRSCWSKQVLKAFEFHGQTVVLMLFTDRMFGDSYRWDDSFEGDTNMYLFIVNGETVTCLMEKPLSWIYSVRRSNSGKSIAVFCYHEVMQEDGDWVFRPVWLFFDDQGHQR
jgi:hypothetical protein